VCNSQPTVPSAFHWSWEAIDKPYEYDKVRFDQTDAIKRNNRMVRDFLRSDSDILVKMDIDQVYPKDYFTVMVPLVKKYKVVGPLIFCKWEESDYIPLLCNKNTFPIIRRKNWFKIAPESGILSVNYAHTNLFYHRSVLENIKPPWYDIKYTRDNCSLDMNIDYSFIDKILAQGFKTHINMNMVVGHLVEECIDYNAYKRRHR